MRYHLPDLADDDRFIDGIFKYCDRWCERCPFASRCRHYATLADFSGPVAGDPDTMEFWTRLGDVLARTQRMLRAIALEHGIDPDVEPTRETAEPRNDRTVNDYGLPTGAAEYGSMVDAWFDAEMGAFQQKQDELEAMALMGIECGASYEQARRINDAVEVVRWYQHQIPMRLSRALAALADAVDGRSGAEARERYRTIADGSAKVALIGVDRSIAAWGTLYEQFPEKADGILRALVRLQRFAAEIEGVFPEARAFVRPGFDMPPQG